MDHHQHSPQATVQCSQDPVHVGDTGYSTLLRNLLVRDAGAFHDTLDGSPLPSTTQQQGNGYSYSAVGQVEAMVNIYSAVVAGSPNHQPSPKFSGLDEIYQTSVDDNVHQRPFMALLSLLVDSMTNGARRNARFDSDTSQTDDQTLSESRIVTDVVPNLSGHGRYKTEETQIPMMPFGAKLECSYPPTSFECSTSGSRRPRMKHQEANWASPTHKEGEHLASAMDPPSRPRTPQDRGGMRVEKTAKKQYQCSSCWVIFSQRQGLSRHRKDKHEPKNRCGFCTVFTWSKGRHYNYQRHLREKHPEAVQSPSVSATPTTRRRGVNVGGWHSCQDSVFRHTIFASDSSVAELAGLGCGNSLV